MLARIKQLKSEHDLIYQHLETLRRTALIFQLGEHERAEALERWRQITPALREAVEFFSNAAPKHFEAEGKLCAQISASPSCTNEVRELELDQHALAGLCGRSLEPVKSWLKQLHVPTRDDAGVFLALLDELKLHLDRHIKMTERCVYPELESYFRKTA